MVAVGEKYYFAAAKQNQGETNRRSHNMNNVKKIGCLFLVLGVMTGFVRGASQESGLDATLGMSIGGGQLGIGGSSGSGTLTYRKKNYPFRVSGLAVGRVGVTNSSAVGDVFNLKHLQDFNGHYTVSGAGTRGVTLGAGQTGTIMSNQAGVIVRLSSTQKGIAVNATGGGLTMQLQ